MFQARGAISVYLMLLRCLELRDTIRRFFKCADSSTMDPKYNPIFDMLSDDEWDEVRVMTLVMETFYKNIKSLEGNASSSGFGSLWQTIVNLEEIYTFLSGAEELSVHEMDGFAQSEYMVSGVALALARHIFPKAGHARRRRRALPLLRGDGHAPMPAPLLVQVAVERVSSLAQGSRKIVPGRV